MSLENQPKQTPESFQDTQNLDLNQPSAESVGRPEVISEWSDLSDPMTALRFRRGMEAAYTKEPLNEYYKKTRRFLETYGVTSASHAESYDVAVATFFGITEEQWHEQLAGDTEHVPAEQLSKFEQNIMLPESILVDHARRIHSREEVENLEPVKVFAENDKYMTIPVEEFDAKLQHADNGEKLALIQHYLLPRIDQQIDIIKDPDSDSSEIEKAHRAIDNIEEILSRIGVGRIESMDEYFNPQSHRLVKTTGSGPYWMVSQEIRPGYNAGRNQVIRKASVNIQRLSLEDLPDEEQEKIRRQKAAKAARTATYGATNTRRDAGDNSNQDTLF